jgi:hypothetical protein
MATAEGATPDAVMQAASMEVADSTGEPAEAITVAGSTVEAAASTAVAVTVGAVTAAVVDIGNRPRT